MFRSRSRDNEPTYPYIDPYRRQNYRHDCRRRQNSLARRKYTKIVAGTARSATKRTSRNPGHAHHFARSRSEIEVRGKVRAGSVAETAFVDLDPVWGKGIVNSDR